MRTDRAVPRAAHRLIKLSREQISQKTWELQLHHFSSSYLTSTLQINIRERFKEEDGHGGCLDLDGKIFEEFMDTHENTHFQPNFTQKMKKKQMDFLILIFKRYMLRLETKEIIFCCKYMGGHSWHINTLTHTPNCGMWHLGPTSLHTNLTVPPRPPNTQSSRNL